MNRLSDEVYMILSADNHLPYCETPFKNSPGINSLRLIVIDEKEGGLRTKYLTFESMEDRTKIWDKLYMGHEVRFDKPTTIKNHTFHKYLEIISNEHIGDPTFKLR